MTWTHAVRALALAAGFGAFPDELFAQRRAAVKLFEIPAETNDGGELFDHVSSAVVTQSGLIAIADDRAQRVRLFDSQARLIRAWGRVGSGPGEFKGLWTIGECSSGYLYAYDRMLQRVSVLPIDGGATKVYPIDKALTSLVCGPRGVLVLPQLPDLKGPPLGNGGRVLYRGTVEFRDDQVRRVGEREGVTLGEPRTLGQFSSFAVSGDQVAIATGDSAWIDVYSRSGTRLGGFRAGVAGRKPTMAQYTFAAEAISSSLSEESQRRASVRLMLRQPMPERLPPYAGIVAAGDDGFWVIEGFGGDLTIRVARYGSSLKRLYEVDLPGQARVLSGSADYLLAIVSDSDGSEMLVGLAPRSGRK
jgi:hypothetical protein